MIREKSKTRDMVYIGIFAVLIAVCSWISIPLTVPFTLQTMGVFLTIGILGGKRGTLAVTVYTLMGIVGLPVFSGFRGGIGVLIGNTGGYVTGFLLSALLMWGIEKLLGRNLQILAFSMVLGLVACYIAGTLWFMAVYASGTGSIGIGTVLSMCVIPFIIPDIIKIIIALVLTQRIGKAIGFHNPDQYR